MGLAFGKRGWLLGDDGVFFFYFVFINFFL